MSVADASLAIGYSDSGSSSFVIEEYPDHPAESDTIYINAGSNKTGKYVKSNQGYRVFKIFSNKSINIRLLSDIKGVEGGNLDLYPVGFLKIPSTSDPYPVKIGVENVSYFDRIEFNGESYKSINKPNYSPVSVEHFTDFYNENGKKLDPPKQVKGTDFYSSDPCYGVVMCRYNTTCQIWAIPYDVDGSVIRTGSTKQLFRTDNGVDEFVLDYDSPSTKCLTYCLISSSEDVLIKTISESVKIEYPQSPITDAKEESEDPANSDYTEQAREFTQIVVPDADGNPSDVIFNRIDKVRMRNPNGNDIYLTFGEGLPDPSVTV